jgi:hypothetical protein
MDSDVSEISKVRVRVRVRDVVRVRVRMRIRVRVRVRVSTRQIYKPLMDSDTLEITNERTKEREG